ncbi:MAG: lipocalin family protein [Wenzhouxiangellaceae bacterium]
MRQALFLTLLLASLLTQGCAIVFPGNRGHGPLQTVEYVDLQRYSGEWYVIANIPYFGESGNVESRAIYAPREDGRLDDIYLYRDDFGAELERMEGVAWVKDETSNAHWKVRFYWPLTFDYHIIALDDDYQHVAVAHPTREYGWIMARQPRISDSDYQALLQVFADQGYDTAEFMRVPQFPEQVGQPGFQDP